MANIYLKQEQSDGTYQADTDCKVSVQEQSYPKSKLFKRFKHTLNQPKLLNGSNIVLCNCQKKEDSQCANGQDCCTSDGKCGKLTLTADDGYESANLQEVHVYHNKHDEKKTPLVLVFIFENGNRLGGPGNKYWKRSQFKGKLDKGESENISGFTQYNNEYDPSLLKVLLEENDQLEEPLTYDIGRIEGGSDGKYNDDKIAVEDDTIYYGDLSNKGFKTFSHTPTWNMLNLFDFLGSWAGRGDNRDKKACLIYDKNTLIKKGGSEEVPQIQGETYDYIDVYFGSDGKAVRKKDEVGNGDLNSSHQSKTMPLLLELQKKGVSTGPEYYVHKYDSSNKNYYWAKLPGDNGDATTLKDLLVDARMGTKPEEPGYVELLEAMLGLTEDDFGEEDDDFSDLSSKLEGAKGHKLKRLLGQKVGGSRGKSVLVLLLQRIQFDLTPSVVILIGEKDASYDEAKVRKAVKNLQPSRDINRVDMNGGSKIITVSEVTNKLANCLDNYKVYEHNLSNVTTELGAGHSAGIRFLISSSIVNSKYIELKLYNKSGMELEPQNIHYTYYKKKGDPSNENKVYVFFYNNDTVPLMIYYSGTWFKPASRDDYFMGWVDNSDALSSVTLPCCIQEDEIGKCGLVSYALDLVNMELNQIDLDPEKTIKGTDYGIPIPKGQEPQEQDIKRVDVTQMDRDNYKRVVHRTTNGLRIGDIYYNREDITFDGIKVNGGTIKVGAGEKHSSFVSENNPNTVVVYYSKSDSTYQLPQLILILHTDEAISSGPGPITATKGSNYGYYILATGEGGTGYQYTWRTVEESKGVTLDDATEFKLLNSAVIILNKQSPYQEGEIKPAIRGVEPKLTSPGNSGDINRLKEKDIYVRYADSDREAQCVTQFGYKVYTHDITSLVKPDPPISNKIRQVGIITGLRFLIPTKEGNDQYCELTLCPSSESEGQYKEVKLCPTDPGLGDNCKHVDYLYNQGSHHKVHVYFFKGIDNNGAQTGDPRPLLICYNGSTYRPKKTTDPIPEKQVTVEYDTWVKVGGISSCVCTVSEIKGNEDLLNSLEEVVGYLNPVQLNPKQVPSPANSTITAESPYEPRTETAQSEYPLHTYTHTAKIKMKVTRSSVKCYKKFSYEPDGTQGNSNGFRLGDLVYSKTDNVADAPIGKLDYTKKGDTTNRYYPLIKATVYYYDQDEKYDDPLLVELVFQTSTGGVTPSNKTEYYKLTERDSEKVEWTYDKNAKTGQLGQENELVTYLDKIRYSLKKALKIEIHHRGNSYKVQVSENKGGKGKFTPLNNGSKQISVSPVEPCEALNNTGYKCFKHELTSLGPEIHHQIGGLKFIIPGKETGQEKEITLYKETYVELNPIDRITYNKCEGNVFVYFYGNDPRPLAFSYGKSAYRPQDLATYFEKWVQVKGVDKCTFECLDLKCPKLLEILVCVSNFLNPVKLDQVATGKPYDVHRFNGNDIQIKVTETKGNNKFCYNKYIHTHKGTGSNGTGFRLGNIIHDRQCIVDNGNGCISAIPENSSPYKASSEVVVYYYKEDKTRNNPLLVALKKNGTSSNQYQPYFELKDKGKPAEAKKYVKQDKRITLDDTAGGTLDKKLDQILYNISNRLQVILSQRLIPKASEQMPTYKAQLYDNGDRPLPEKESTTTTMDIKVTEVDCTAVNSKGYRCFQHHVSTVSRVEEIGGLRLYLWDNRKDKTKNGNCTGKTECRELTLQDSGRAVNTTYTTCKGDIYVYFYGDDPRPLLLCYSGEGYRPKGMDSYTGEWEKATGVNKCECTEEGFNPGSLLQELYKVSMFMNPVKLAETKKAGSILTEQMKSEPGTGKEPSPHRYTIDSGFNTVQVTITGLDLDCYKRYTHRPPLGYRLGNVQWNGSKANGVTYSPSKQLLSVSLYYYMYDARHLNPLLVELGFKGELSEYYRLGKKVVSGTGEPPTWVPITANGTTSSGNGGGPSTTDPDDAEFLAEAHRIEGLINDVHLMQKLRVTDFKLLSDELQELIEGKAYKVRTNLEIKYDPKDSTTLILATDENCMEESMMGYLVGGGALGGGGYDIYAKCILIYIEHTCIETYIHL